MIDCKDHVKAIKRGSGYLVYIPKTMLEIAKIDFSKELIVRRFPSKEKTIILKFKEV